MIFNKISSFVKSSFCDWPGEITSVIFLKGCNFRCPTCHNIELLDTNKIYDYDRILNHLIDNYDWINHVTISGGEPTIYRDLSLLIKDLYSKNFKIKLDSNGSNPDLIKEVIPYVSLFAIDIKSTYEKYYEASGYRIKETDVRSNFDKIFNLSRSHPNKFWFRTTLIPSLTNEDILKIKKYPPPNFSIHFQKFQEINH